MVSHKNACYKPNLQNITAIFPQYVTLHFLIPDTALLCYPSVAATLRRRVLKMGLKDNQPELRREAERFTTGPPAAIHSEGDQELRCGHWPQIDGPVANRWGRVVKTLRLDPKRQVTVRQEGDRRRKSKTARELESTHFSAPNFELGAIPPAFIHPLGRSRWRIDAEVFQTITADGHLKHLAVHQSTALVVRTMIRLLAYALSLVFYQRQVCTHARGPCDRFHEFAKHLAYGFVALAPNTS